jgi:hypothetical protein
MSDITERLRACIGIGIGDPDCNCVEAADENDRLREALAEPVAWITKAGLENWLKGSLPENHILLRTGGDMRVALYALSKEARE